MRKTKIAVTDETRAKLREAQLRYLASHPHQNLGSRHSPEIRKKLSEIALAGNAARREAGIPHPNIGRIVSDEQKERQRKAMTGRRMGPENPAWKGGHRTARGYIFLLRRDHPAANANGYVWEHRIVMEEKLGRPLRKNEIVHHINGIKSDNRPENLQLFQNDAEHWEAHMTCPHCGKRIYPLKS